jgi:phosphate transport system substrate-binding protein
MGEMLQNIPGSIGYIEVQYLSTYHIGAGSVLNPAGKYVKASRETLLGAVHAVMDTDWTRFGVSLTNAPGTNSFPITSFTWLYLRKPNDSRRAAALTDLVNWMFSDGQSFALSEGYPQLPDPLVAAIKARLGSSLTPTPASKQP